MTPLQKFEVDVKHRAATGAVSILERVARGAGATKWFYIEDGAHVVDLVNEFSPGSVVSAYFDGRMEVRPYSTTLQHAIVRKISEGGEVVVGLVEPGSYRVTDIDYVCSSEELAELLADLKGGVRVFFGHFPGRENSADALTVTVPDLDGVIRNHPH